MTTIHGYDMYECLSAVQKCVRRGLEKDALYWATELQMSSPAMESALWGRILIMASEDVGLASDAASADNVALTCEALYRNWMKKPKVAIFALHAMLALIRSKKSRITDSACCWLMVEEKLGRREKKLLPDWALDKHTIRGRAMGRGQLQFWTEGVKLANCDLADPYEEEARELMIEAERKGKL